MIWKYYGTIRDFDSIEKSLNFSLGFEKLDTFLPTKLISEVNVISFD